MMSQRLKILICSLTVIIMLLILAWIDLSICVDKGRRYNMEHLALSVVRFNAAHGRLPTSIEDLATNTFLPPKSDIYACPLIHGRFFFLPNVPLTNMEYEILFNQTNVVVQYTPGVRAFLKHIVRDGGLQSLELRIDSKDKVMGVTDH
jgi:hypothetical protein